MTTSSQPFIRHELCGTKHPTQDVTCGLVKNPWSHDHVGHRDGSEPLEQRTITWPSRARETEPICPPWCARHDDRHQAWEERTDGGWLRDHADEGTSVAGDVWVNIVAEENERHTISEAIVGLLVDAAGGGTNIDLTPSQARELAALLMNAADAIDVAERAQVRA